LFHKQLVKLNARLLTLFLLTGAVVVGVDVVDVVVVVVAAASAVAVAVVVDVIGSAL